MKCNIASAIDKHKDFFFNWGGLPDSLAGEILSLYTATCDKISLIR
jgi:hypothetical protein